MLAKYPLSTVADEDYAAVEAPHAPLSELEVAQLVHLARAVLLKSPDDLAAIASAAPSMPRDWLTAFSAEKARAEAEARFWMAATTYLMASTAGRLANDD
jgi:hypothetical protein